MSKEQIIKTLSTPKMKKYFQEHGILHLSLFGSFAQNTQTDESDIDLLYEKNRERKIGLFDLAVLKEYIYTLFHKDIDLVSAHFLDSSVKKDILSTKIDLF